MKSMRLYFLLGTEGQGFKTAQIWQTLLHLFVFLFASWVGFGAGSRGRVVFTRVRISSWGRRILGWSRPRRHRRYRRHFYFWCSFISQNLSLRCSTVDWDHSGCRSRLLKLEVGGLNSCLEEISKEQVLPWQSCCVRRSGLAAAVDVINLELDLLREASDLLKKF